MRSMLHRPEVRSIGVYGAATGLAAVLTLVLTRELWRSLTADAFGVWALVDPMLLPAASLVLLGADHAIVKQLRADRQPLALVVGRLLATSLPAALLCVLALGLVVQFAFRIDWTGALLLTLAGEALILVVQTAFRAGGAVWAFAGVLLSRNVLYLAAVLGVMFRHGAIGMQTVFFTRGVCVLLVSLAAMPVLRPVFRVSPAWYADALRYGAPLLLTTFIYAVGDMADRWVLVRFSGVAAVGIYALHLKVAAILAQAIVIPFGLWFPPERFKHLEDADGGHRFFVRTAAVLAIICGSLSGAVWLARGPLMALIAPGAPVLPAVLACCLASVTCLAISQALNVGLLKPGHTGKNAWCTGAAAIGTFLVAAIAVPSLGTGGAAAARLAGGTLFVVLTAVWSFRVAPVPFPYAAIALYLGGSGLAAFIIDAMCASSGLPGIVVGLVAWTGAMACFGSLFWVWTARWERRHSGVSLAGLTPGSAVLNLAHKAGDVLD